MSIESIEKERSQSERINVTGLSVHIAKTDSEREAIFRVRYEAYFEEGAIDASPSGVFSDEFDDLPTSLLFGVIDDRGTVVGSLRFSVEPPKKYRGNLSRSCPEFAVFPDEMNSLYLKEQLIVSGSRLSVMPGRGEKRRIALLLLIAEAQAARAVNAKWGIAVARGSHLLMYERFLMRQVCEPRRMPKLNYDFALLASDLEANMDSSMRQFPHMLLEYFNTKHPNWQKEVLRFLKTIDGSKKWLP